ncbi:MAG: alanine racemase [Cyclobacteriaceae bacterium]
MKNLEHTSHIELSLSALKTNIKYIKNKLGDSVLFSAVVKGNAYGHGIEQFSLMVQRCKVNHFSVFSANEAKRVMEVLNKDVTIMIMGFIDNQDLDWAIEKEVQFFVFEPRRLKAAIETAKKLKKKAIVHLEVETGMNRLGIDEAMIREVITLIKKNKEHLQVEGICTHYAGAESISNYLRIKDQIFRFNKLYKKFLDNGIVPKYRHTACSAATINFPETIMDMVRIGILMYGFWPSPESFVFQFKDQANKKIKDPLKRVISWKSKVMSVKQVKKGDFVGYGTSYLATQNMTIAIVPVGYAYGYSRNLSNLGYVLIRGKRSLVIGMVNMNLMIVDVTELENVQQDDEVVIIGTQKKQTITVASFSEMSQQLNYELLTRLPTYIPRLVVR